MKKPALYLLGLWLILGQAIAQDIRYSQYFNTPLTMNPALTGVGIEHLRATISYRRQDAGPATPFSTKGVSLDKSVGRFGLGFTLNSNGAGETSIKTLQLAASLSYGLPFGYKQSNRLTAGLQVGAINKSLDPTKLTFDNQYSADIGYNPNIGSGETFETNSIVKPAISMGLHWRRNGGKKTTVKPHLSYGLQNINQPDISFFGDEIKYHTKHVIQGGADIAVSDGFQVKPGFYHINQGPFNETGFGVIGTYQNRDKNEIHGGLFGKAGKAMVVYAGYTIDRFLVGMSYDVMTGPVKEAGKGYNAFELSLTFTPKAKERKPKTEEPQKEPVRSQKPEEKPKAIVKNEVRSTEKPTEKPTEKTPVSRNQPPADSVKSSVSNTVAAPILQEPMKTEPVQSIPMLIARLNVVTVQIQVPLVDEAPAMDVLDPVDDSDMEPQPQPVAVIETPDANTTVHADQEKPQVIPSAVNQTPTSPAPVTPATTPNVTPVAAAAETQPPTTTATPATTPVATSVVEATENVPVATISEPITQQSEAPSVFTPIVPNNKIIAPDSDGDGVNDYEDPCPFIKGSLSTRGCPDSDDDGIVDMVDFCPLESGPKSNGGCPVKNVVSTGGQKVMATFDHVLFNTGSTTLTIDNTYDIIERAVELMYQDKNTYVLISGHTDAEGDASSNMMLSQQRADKVTRYFVQQGIKETRIKTIPYGENMPISGNASEASRKLNRRVEITILKKND